MARRTSSLNNSTAASPRLWCSAASISWTGPNRVEVFLGTVTMRGLVMGTIGAYGGGGLSGGHFGLGSAALTIRIGMAGDCFLFRARFGL